MFDQLDASQLVAVTHLLQILTDPVSRSLANAPFDDEGQCVPPRPISP